LALEFEKHVLADAVRGAKLANAVTGQRDRFSYATVAGDPSDPGFKSCQPLQDFSKRQDVGGFFAGGHVRNSLPIDGAR
jgi:hypothetical protein